MSENRKLDHIEIRTDTDLDVVDIYKDVEIDTNYIDLDAHSKQVSS